MALEPTVRRRILEATRDYLAAMEHSSPVDDPYGYAPGSVGVGPLGDFDKRKRFVIGITAGREVKQDRYPLKECILPINVEFQYQVQTDEGVVADVVEDVMGAIQRRMLEIAKNNRPAPFDQLVVDLRETGNDIVLESSLDRFVEGVVFWEYLYRHHHDDPRKLVNK